MDTVKRISFAENANEKNKLLLSESHQSTYTAYQKNIDYLTVAKKIKTASKSLTTSFADTACVDINDIVTDNDNFTSNLYSLQRDQQDFAKLMEELRVKFNYTETSRAEKAQILTLKPDLWTTKET